MLSPIFHSLVIKLNWLRAPSSKHQFENLSKPTGTYVKIHDGGLLHSVNDDLLEIMIESSELNPKFRYPISFQLISNSHSRLLGKAD